MATSTSLSAPRINQSMLTDFIGQQITIIGKVISTSAQQVQLEASVRFYIQTKYPAKVFLHRTAARLRLSHHQRVIILGILLNLQISFA